MLTVWVVVVLIAPFFIDPSLAAMTIKEMKAEPGSESFWKFAFDLPFSFEAEVFYALASSGALGMMGHYYKQWQKGEIVGCLGEYLFKDHWKNTLGAFTGVLGTAVAALAMNVFVDDAGHFVGWLNVVGWGLMAGYTLDSTANKGEKAADTK